MKMTFRGRYGETRQDEYIEYHFKDVTLSKLFELICESSPIGQPWDQASLFGKYKGEVIELIITSADNGYYIEATDKDLISCWNRKQLHEIICPDDIEFPLGSVLPVEVAWEVIKTFVKTGELSDKIEWISWNDVPEDANWTHRL